MHEELQRIGLNFGHTKLAIIDSGFNWDENSKKLTHPIQLVSALLSGEGDPGKDEVGHGTVVAGIIGGIEGGIAPDLVLSLYRNINNTMLSGFLLPQDETAAIKKACDDGNEIISASQDYILPEAAQYARNHGCWIIEASGNRGTVSSKSVGFYNTDLFNNHDYSQNILYVGSTNSFERESSFSSNGATVFAPGENVYSSTMNVSGTLVKPTASNQCDGEGIFVTGTSFATPIVSAVAGEVIGVFKKNAEFLKMSADDQHNLVAVTLVASSGDRKAIDGLKAVLLAEQWTKKPKSSWWLAPVFAAACLESRVLLTSPQSTDYSSYNAKFRRYESLCPNPDFLITERGVLTLIGHHDLELAAMFLNRIPAEHLKNIKEAAREDLSTSHLNLEESLPKNLSEYYAE